MMGKKRNGRGILIASVVLCLMFAGFAVGFLNAGPVAREELAAFSGKFEWMERVHHRRRTQSLSHWKIYAEDGRAFRMLSTHGFDEDAFNEKIHAGDEIMLLYEPEGADIFEIRSEDEVIHSYEQSVDGNTGNRKLGAGILLAFAGYFAVTSAQYARKGRGRK